jgi:Tol biopolymer transport system component
MCSRWVWIPALLLLVTLPAVPAGVARIELVSVSSAGTQGDTDVGMSSEVRGAISADGRFVAFLSAATNLVPGDTNKFVDLFVRDRQTGTTERVDLSSSGDEANGDCKSPKLTISADGRFVAYASAASNLVPGDTNRRIDCFVRDRQSGSTDRISVSSTGDQGNDISLDPAISADGRFVAFDSMATNLVPGKPAGSVYVRDRLTGMTEWVAAGSLPSVSADGRFVAFHSAASDLVPNDTNRSVDCFVRDRLTGSTERISVTTSGDQALGGDSIAPEISANGRFVAFVSEATNLVLGDTNGHSDVFVHDRLTQGTARVSLSSSREQGNAESRWGQCFPHGRPGEWRQFLRADQRGRSLCCLRVHRQQPGAR